MADFSEIYAALKPVFTPCVKKLVVKADTPAGYELQSKTPSPFPQHKGQPLYFGGVRLGKAYVSVHLMPLYMCEPLQAKVSPELRKRMQGKSCFNFKTMPEKKLVDELRTLAKAGLAEWTERKWL